VQAILNDPMPALERQEPSWWRRHWARTGLVEIQTADTMNDGWTLWSAWQRQIAPDNTAEIATVEADAGRHLTYIRLVGHRRADMALACTQTPGSQLRVTAVTVVGVMSLPSPPALWAQLSVVHKPRSYTWT
jgi:hypothetical protein